MATPRYLIDTSVFITSRDTMFGFDINTSFWAWMDKALKADIIGSPREVYREVVENARITDDIARWVKTRRKDGLCIEPDAAIRPQGRYQPRIPWR